MAFLIFLTFTDKESFYSGLFHKEKRIKREDISKRDLETIVFFVSESFLKKGFFYNKPDRRTMIASLRIVIFRLAFYQFSSYPIRLFPRKMEPIGRTPRCGYPFFFTRTNNARPLGQDTNRIGYTIIPIRVLQNPGNAYPPYRPL